MFQMSDEQQPLSNNFIINWHLYGAEKFMKQFHKINNLIKIMLWGRIQWYRWRKWMKLRLAYSGSFDQ